MNRLQEITERLLRTANLNLINAKLYDNDERVLHHLHAAILKMQSAKIILAAAGKAEE